MADQKITTADVYRVAKLARLAIPSDQISKLTGELESILGYVARIGEVNLDGVPPMAHPLPLVNVLRDDDQVTPALTTEEVLKNAPDTDAVFFKVPKVLGGDAEAPG